MSKLNTMVMPLIGNETKVVSGSRIRLQVGSVWIMFFIHDDTLSHWASGYQLGSLNPVKVRHLVHTGYRTMTDRQAAKRLIEELINHHGVAGLIAAFDSKPRLNEETKKGCGINTKPKP